MNLKQWLKVYVTIFLCVLLLDALWLGLIAFSWYQAAIGHLMREQIQWAGALLFYGLYPLALTSILHIGLNGTLGEKDALRDDKKAFLLGAFVGAVGYGVYNLTNWATLMDWPWWLTLMDWSWGPLMSAMSTWVGYRIGHRG